MAFDIEGYRKAAKEAGLSDEEIQKDIDEETKGVAPTGADADMANVKVGKDFMGIPEWLQPAAGLAAASALLGAGATGLGMKIKDRMNKPEQPTSPRVEPTFGIPDVESAPQPQNKFTPPQGDVTDVASRPVGEPRLQIGGPRALPAPEVSAPAAVAPAPAPTAPAAPAPAAPVAEAPVAPPADVAPAPVQPKPLSELEQLRLEKAKFELEAAKNKEARAAELHANRLAAEVKRGELSSQKKTSSGINPQDRQMLESSEKAKFDKAIAADQKAVATAKAPVPAVPATAIPTAESPITAATPAVSEPVVAAAKEPVPPKGAKWPGGAEGSALQLFGGTKKNLTPESMAALELFKGEAGPLTMPPTGGSIHQIDQASKFYEKHTGEPLPRNAEGKLTRIPEEQMQKLHAGIRTELEDAVKGNKLGSLGKGAMAAAALLGLTGAVQAAQKGDFGPLREAGFNIGGPIALGQLGLTALSRAAGTGFTAATYAGNLNEGEQQELARRRHEYQQKESQKLGSPLRSVPPPR